MRDADPYAVLGVHPGASYEEIHQAWVDLARRHHPDHGGDPATMQAINDAWASIRTGPSSAPPQPPPRSQVPEDHIPDPWHSRTEFVAPRRRGSPVAAFVPVGLFACSVAAGCIALALDEPALLGFAAFMFFVSCLAVAASTLWSMRQ